MSTTTPTRMRNEILGALFVEFTNYREMITEDAEDEGGDDKRLEAYEEVFGTALDFFARAMPLADDDVWWEVIIGRLWRVSLREVEGDKALFQMRQTARKDAVTIIARVLRLYGQLVPGEIDPPAPEEPVHTKVAGGEEPLGTFTYPKTEKEIKALWDQPERVPPEDDFSALWKKFEGAPFCGSFGPNQPQPVRLRLFQPTESLLSSRKLVAGQGGVKELQVSPPGMEGVGDPSVIITYTDGRAAEMINAMGTVYYVPEEVPAGTEEGLEWVRTTKPGDEIIEADWRPQDTTLPSQHETLGKFGVELIVHREDIRAVGLDTGEGLKFYPYHPGHVRFRVKPEAKEAEPGTGLTKKAEPTTSKRWITEDRLRSGEKIFAVEWVDEGAAAWNTRNLEAPDVDAIKYHPIQRRISIHQGGKALLSYHEKDKVIFEVEREDA